MPQRCRTQPALFRSAEWCTQASESRLESLEVRDMYNSCKTPTSNRQAVSTKFRGKSLILKDLVIGTQDVVHQKRLSRHLLFPKGARWLKYPSISQSRSSARSFGSGVTRTGRKVEKCFNNGIRIARPYLRLERRTQAATILRLRVHEVRHISLRFRGTSKVFFFLRKGEL